MVQQSIMTNDRACSTNDVEIPHMSDSPHKEIKRRTYRSPEVADLGKASELLQGGCSRGNDNFYQTMC